MARSALYFGHSQNRYSRTPHAPTLRHIFLTQGNTFRKGNAHAAAPDIPLLWLIFPLSANLRHLRPENNRFFRCLPASSTYVRKRYQILGVNPPLIHSFLSYILHEFPAECNHIFSICGYGHFIRDFLRSRAHSKLLKNNFA